MKNNHFIKNWSIMLLSLFSLIVISCDSVGLLSEKNSWIVDDINNFGDFIKVYIVLQISIIIVAIIFGFLLGKAGYYISLIIHFIWIVSSREYGFLIVILLFSLFTIISFIYNLIRFGAKKNPY